MQNTIANPPGSIDPIAATARPVKFIGPRDFQMELKRRVDDYFHRTGKSQRDCPRMYIKTATLFVAIALLYTVLVFFASTWWEALPLAMIFGVVLATFAFNVQHDGGHHAYSNHPWINKLAAMTLELIGGSSYLWHWKHVIFHHTYTNISDEDTDVDLGFLGRLTPHKKRLWFHRWQHIYLWPLYGLIAIKWQLFDDYHDVIVGRIGNHRISRPKGWDLVIFIAGKATFLTLAFAIPLMFHRFWIVAVIYAVTSIVMGMVLSVVFQLAHCVEGTDFPLPSPDLRKIDNAWAIHEVETTVDFARGSGLAAYMLGGLNFQIEHHLCPRICHINYPAISKIVEETCRELGVRYMAHKTFWSGVASHYRFLRQMGIPQVESIAPWQSIIIACKRVALFS